MTGTAAQDLIGWMTGLSEPTRLRLLLVLEEHELGVAELCEVLQMPQSTVSRHLKVLGDGGWVSRNRQGTTNLYRMETTALVDGALRLWEVARDQTKGWATLAQDRLRLQETLRRRRLASERFFEDAAHRWETTKRELYGDCYVLAALAALVPDGWTVADLGCGTGETTALLAEHVAKVVGVDQSEAMLASARARTEGFANVDLRRGDLSAIPLEDESCEAALMLLVLTYVPTPRPAVAEMGRILRPGGRAIVVDLMRHDRDDFRREMGQHSLGFEVEEMRRLLRSAGLRPTTSVPLPVAPGAKGPSLLMTVATKGGETAPRT